MGRSLGAESVMPVREWMKEGALVDAGSDYDVGTYHVMRSVRCAAPWVGHTHAHTRAPA
jgi:predicted amidohydrolase YtcJ